MALQKKSKELGYKAEPETKSEPPTSNMMYIYICIKFYWHLLLYVTGGFFEQLVKFSQFHPTWAGIQPNYSLSRIKHQAHLEFYV